jgi:hypothetical protein
VGGEDREVSSSAPSSSRTLPLAGFHGQYSTTLIEELDEASATFGATEPLDEWEMMRRELAAFHAVHERKPRRRALHASERRLAAWAERQTRQGRGSRWAHDQVLLRLTPGWTVAGPNDPARSSRRSTFLPPD